MVQLFCWAMCWVVNLALGLAFPAWIVMLIPIRAYLLPNLFTEAQLEALDADPEEVASQARTADCEGQMKALMSSLSRARSKREKWKDGACSGRSRVQSKTRINNCIAHRLHNLI